MLIVIKKPEHNLLALSSKIAETNKLADCFAPTEKKSVRVINSCDCPTADNIVFFPLSPDGLFAAFINPKTNGYKDLPGCTIIVGEDLIVKNKPNFYPVRGTIVFSRFKNGVPKSVAENVNKIILNQADYGDLNYELDNLSPTDLRIIGTMCSETEQINLLKKMIE